MDDNITYRDPVVNTIRVSAETRAVNNAGMAFKDNLRRFRKAAGLSQEALALACGWSGQSRISNYEKGIREPTLEETAALAVALGVQAADLIDGNVGGTERSDSGTVSAASESFSVRLDPAMLAEAEKLAEIAAAIGRQEHTRLQKMEIVATLYPKYDEFIRAAEAQRPSTGSPDDQSPAARATRRA